MPEYEVVLYKWETKTVVVESDGELTAEQLANAAYDGIDHDVNDEWQTGGFHLKLDQHRTQDWFVRQMVEAD